ncbi:unnamed protein product, partial [Aureobasidium mustum]
MPLLNFFGFGTANHNKTPTDAFVYETDGDDFDDDGEDSSNDAPYTRPGRAAALSRSSRIPSAKTLANSTLASLPKLKAELQEAAKNVPKYLFRMWHKGSGHDYRLNSAVKVIPHAFFQKKGHKSVYDMTYDQFLNNARAHVSGHRAPLSEFSSWSQSPYFAFNYAMHVKRSHNTNIHVAIIDAEALISTNSAFNVAVLHKIFKGDFSAEYHEEYLVHGIVQGPFYKAVPFDQLCSAGLLTYLPSITQSAYPLTKGGLTRLLPRGQKPFKIDDLIKLMKIARLYGASFTVPFAITLFCCRKSPKLWSTLTINDLQRMVDILGGRNKVLEVWGESQNVLFDGTYPKGYEANKQMIRVMRALTHFCWGQETGQKPVNQRLVAGNSVSAADEEEITSGMSSVHVTPAPSKNFAAGPPSGGPQQSRKRSRVESLSPSCAYSSLLEQVPVACPIPSSRISSPYAQYTGDLRSASFPVHSLWTQIGTSDPTRLSSYIEPNKIVMVSVNDDDTLRFQSLPIDNTESTKIGPVEFAYGNSKDGEILWFARIPPNLLLKINGELL